MAASSAQLMDKWPDTTLYLQSLIENNSSLPSSNNKNAQELLTALFRALENDSTTEVYPKTIFLRAESNLHYVHSSRKLTSALGISNFSINIMMVFVCVICAACAYGMTHGLLSLDYKEMQTKIRSGNAKEKSHAAMIMPAIKRHNLLIVTLMIWNIVAIEALPFFLRSMIPDYAAFILSVALVVAICQLLPALILTGTVWLNWPTDPPTYCSPSL